MFDQFWKLVQSSLVFLPGTLDTPLHPSSSCVCQEQGNHAPFIPPQLNGGKGEQPPKFKSTGMVDQHVDDPMTYLSACALCLYT